MKNKQLYIMGQLRDLDDPNLENTLKQELKNNLGQDIPFHCGWKDEESYEVVFEIKLSWVCAFDKYVVIPELYVELFLKPSTKDWLKKRSSPMILLTIKESNFRSHYSRLNRDNGGSDFEKICIDYSQGFGLEFCFASEKELMHLKGKKFFLLGKLWTVNENLAKEINNELCSDVFYCHWDRNNLKMKFDIELFEFMWRNLDKLQGPYANLILGDMSIETPSHFDEVICTSYIDTHLFINRYIELNEQAGGSKIKYPSIKVVDDGLVISMEFE